MQGNPQQTVLAYLAGIIDGEGTIRIGRSNNLTNRRVPAYYAGISCGMTELNALQLLVDTFGGKIRTEGRAENRKPMFRWGTSGTKAVARILVALYPYLRVKQPQAAVVLDFILNKEAPFDRQQGLSQSQLQWREELYLKVRKLNAVGVAATTEYQGPEKGCDSLASCESMRGIPEVVGPLLNK